MLRKIAILTIILIHVVYAQAQEIKFGVHIDPSISFLDSDYSKVKGEDVNFAFAFGVEIEARFSENVGVTFGLDFSLNNGGSLIYNYGGVVFSQSDMDNVSSFKNINNQSPDQVVAGTLTGVDLYAYTKVNYRVSYIELPIGLRLRTAEFGGSYLRAYFHIPLVKIMIPVAAGAKIFAPVASQSGFENDINSTKFGIPQSSTEGEGFVVEPNIWKDITPIQVSVGAGAGVEFNPSDPDGLRLYAGVYYHTGVIDVTGGFLGKTVFTEAETTATTTSLSTREINPRNALHNVVLRIGAIF
jgi:hypothetical protein